MSAADHEKGDRSNLPERPGGCFAQIGPVPFFAEIAELLASLCDETISPAEMERLDRLLCTDAAVRRLYIEYLDIHARLSCRFRSLSEPPAKVDGGVGNAECGMINDELPAGAASADIHPSSFILHPSESAAPAPEPLLPPIIIDTSGPVPSPLFALGSTVGGWLFSYSAATVIMGMAILGAWLYKVSLDSKIAQDQSLLAQRGAEPKPEYVGRITDMADCRWADPQAAPLVAAVALGHRYDLSSGLMEISYDTGAKVILQGPCTYEADSLSGGFLSLGKLTARVESTEPQAANPQSPIPNPKFVVKTPTAVVTDLGTEFGVEVATNGNTTSYVFRGSVKMRLVVGDSRGPEQETLLRENESARVERGADDRGFRVVRFAADPAAFVRAGQFSELADETRLAPFRRWQAFSEELRKRDDLVAYYDFQPDESNRFVLRNRAATGEQFDGRIGNSRWVLGRFPGKYALSFGRPTSGVHVNIPVECRQLTLAAWVRLERLTKINALLMSEGWNQRGKISLLLTPPGTLRLGYCCDGSNCPQLDSPVVLGSDGFGRWRMVAFAVDLVASEVRFFLDGKPVGKQPLPPATGALRWPPEPP